MDQGGNTLLGKGVEINIDRKRGVHRHIFTETCNTMGRKLGHIIGIK